MELKRVLTILVLIAIILGTFTWVFVLPSTKEVLPTAQKVSIVASFYPLAEIAQNVGGELVNVKNMTPTGVEPHDYEPTAQQVVEVNNAQLFLFNGNGLDSWADKLKSEVERKGVVTLRVSDHIDSLQNPEEEENDPHFWLNPLNMVKETELVTNALIAIDPNNRATYEQNRDSYKQALMQLDQEYMRGLAQCELKEIITSHDAFNYLAQRYGFKATYIAGLSPEEEPSAQRMAEIVDQARANKVKYILFETLVSPKLAQTIADEIGAQTLVLNPLEGLTTAELQAGKNYVSVMRENLATLKTALACQ